MAPGKPGEPGPRPLFRRAIPGNPLGVLGKIVDPAHTGESGMCAEDLGGDYYDRTPAGPHQQGSGVFGGIHLPDYTAAKLPSVSEMFVLASLQYIRDLHKCLRCHALTPDPSSHADWHRSVDSLYVPPPPPPPTTERDEGLSPWISETGRLLECGAMSPPFRVLGQDGRSTVMNRVFCTQPAGHEDQIHRSVLGGKVQRTWPATGDDTAR